MGLSGINTEYSTIATPCSLAAIFGKYIKIMTLNNCISLK